MNINRCIVVFIRGEEMSTNPLSKYFRKPAIYIKLPTGGKFNPEISQTALDEIGVCPMTAIDEITMKNPDALLNGEALISVIKSCVPDIPDPRKLSNIDVEALYLAIQYATYGADMTHTHTCEKCENKNDFNIDINYILNRMPEIEKVDPVEWNELKINIRPATVESITRLAIIELEQKKIVANIKMNIDTDDEGTESTSIARTLYSSFRKIAELNVDLLSNVIDSIETPEGVVDDNDMIRDFLNNIPSNIVDQINEKSKSVSKRPKDASTFEFICPECEHKQQVALEVNPVNFFKRGS
jgi:DNA-directed RNA polymerase subunit M/transcription elongation factor TFIIS